MTRLQKKLEELLGAATTASLGNSSPAARDLAHMLNVSKPTIRMWRTGKRAPHKYMLPIVYSAISELMEKYDKDVCDPVG